jgi:GAF domain-containing protein
LALRAENERLNAHLSSTDAVRDLLVSVRGLERERSVLQHDSAQLAQEFLEYRERAAEMAHDLNDLTSLYVASSQLNGTLVIGRVLKHMCELLEQLVGAQRFVIYLIQPDGRRGVPVSAHGHGVTQLPSISLEDGPIGDVCLTGVAQMGEPAAHVDGAPVAVLPLSVEDQVVGVIVIERLLPHKQAWAHVDRELFTLLSSRGAVALLAANLYTRESGPRAALRDVFEQLESERLRQLTEAEAQSGGDA